MEKSNTYKARQAIRYELSSTSGHIKYATKNGFLTVLLTIHTTKFMQHLYIPSWEVVKVLRWNRFVLTHLLFEFLVATHPG